MNIRISLILLPLLGIAPVLAQGVDPAAVITFESGTPARAADINANFQVLINAINENAARLANLETSSACSTRDFVAGSTYQVYAVPLSFSSDSLETEATSVVAEEYSFYDDGTFDSHGSSTNLVLGPMEGGGVGAKEHTDDYSEAGTWEVEGNELRLSYGDGGEGPRGTISNGGDMVFVLFNEPADEGIRAPARTIGLAVFVKLSRKPVIAQVVRVSEKTTETHFGLKIVLEDTGSGPPLEYGWSPDGIQSNAVWQRGDTLLVSRNLVENYQSWGTFWARRGCSEEFVSDPVDLVH